jgi:enamine deaminase RidA (YjgF/YER057c/UK114 family)
MAQPENVRLSNPDGMHKPPSYSHVAEVTAGKLIFLSGQVALDKDGNLVGKDDLRAQLVQVFENIKTALASVGADFDNVVKVTYFLKDATQILTVRDVRNQYINMANPPASTAVEVSRLASPDWLVEVELIAALP